MCGSYEGLLLYIYTVAVRKNNIYHAIMLIVDNESHSQI